MSRSRLPALLAAGAAVLFLPSAGDATVAAGVRSADQPDPLYTMTVVIGGTGTGRVTGHNLDCPAKLCTHQSYAGDLEELFASPAAGSTFAGWGGCTADAGNPARCSVIVPARNYTVSATFNRDPQPLTVSVSGGGTVTSSPGGISCGVQCSASFAYPGVVTLTATPAPGWALQSWGGACSGAGACTVTMDGPKAVSATFVAIGRLTVTTLGSGAGRVTSSPGGIDCGTACAASFTHGTSVTLAAAPSGGSRFVGWGGACSGTGACTLTIDTDKTVSATFSADRTLTVTKSGTGSGAVTSVPAGIDCGSACSASFVQGARVELRAAAAAGARLQGWGGACAGTGACIVTMDGDRQVEASFAAPVLSDPQRPEEPPRYPVESANPADAGTVAQLAVGVTGNGVVTEGSARSPAAVARRQIACGINMFDCYTRLEPGQSVQLRARPQRGYVFKGWSGPCAGQGERCVVVARELRRVTALFAPSRAIAGVGFALSSPRIGVSWRQSIGTGRLVVSGNVGGVARLRIQVRRPSGGPLLTQQLSLRPGRFSAMLPLRADRLPRGAKLLPGGFMIPVTGTAGGLPLPYQLRTVVIPSPREGVVRSAFATAVRDGPSTARVPRGAREVFAHFRFATQPSSRLPLRVYWYRPNGKLLGSIAKANRPEVVTFVRSSAALPVGGWVAELRAGRTVVMRLSVRIG